VNLRHDFQMNTLGLLAEITRDLVDRPTGTRGTNTLQSEWKLVRELTEVVENTAKNQRGYLDNISTEGKDLLELVKRRIKLLSSEMDPQPAQIEICQNINPNHDGYWCILQARHGTAVDHIDSKGRRW
jgi:hypothetical protein